MIIVLDTNCLIHILGRNSEHHWLYQAIMEGKIKIALTTEILNEYEEILNQFFESETLGENITRLLLNLSTTIRKEVYFRWQLMENDPDDNKYVDCAVASNADYIISDDNHFKILNNIEFPKVVCVRLEKFREIWDEENI